MGGKRGRRIIESDKELAIFLVAEATKNGCRLKIACSDLEVDFKSLSRWEISIKDKRRGPLSEPKNKLTKEEKAKIIEIATSKEYQDDTPWSIVAKLADKGEYIASESSFYKILKEKKLLAHRGRSKPPERRKPQALVADGPNQIWSWDITYLKTSIKGKYFFLYLFMDVFSRKIVGFDIKEEEGMKHSSKLIEEICKNERIEKGKLVLHADNGGSMKGATMLATLEKLGVAPSFSRPRVSDDNPYSEALFKTLKYCPKYPDCFETIEEAKKWMIIFVDWYNNKHLHSGIKYVTPASRHAGLDIALLENRTKIYLEAKAKNPSRWNNRTVRNWEREQKVYLNYLQKERSSGMKKAS